jgi:DNA-binding NarL/FixJ family response regulator
VVSEYLTSQYALTLFEKGSGGRAYLLKQRVGHRIQLMEAIREVANGGSVIDPKVVDVLVDARRRAKNSRLAQLTTREREVLDGIASGKSNAAIAASLFMTKRAVEKSINSIFAKLELSEDPDISRRVAAALIYEAETAIQGNGASPA